MSGQQYVQCLIFIVHGEGPEDEKQASTSLEQSKIEGFALLPRVVKNDLPEVCEFFSQNAIQVVNVEEEYSSLQKAVKNDRAEIIEVLPFAKNNRHIKDCPWHALSIIIQNGLEPLTRRLFPEEVICTEEPKSNDFIPAVDEDNSKFIDRLLVDGANIRYRYPKGESLPHFATVKGLETLVRHFLRNDKSTSLHAASKLGFPLIVRELLNEGADPNVAIDASANVAIDVNPHLKGVTPLHLAIDGRHLEIVRILLENGADVNARTFCGKSVLQAAIEKGRLDIVETVLNHKPDVNNPNNKLTFRMAVNERSEAFRKIVQKLLQYGFTVEAGDVKNADLLLGAIRQNCQEIVRKLIQFGASIDRRCGAITPLHVAARHAQEDMFRLLLEKGGNPDTRCYLERTPLMSAAEDGRAQTVEILLSVGSDVHATDCSGFTALHIAAESGRLDIIDILLRNGADVNAKCTNGRNPLFYAAQNGLLTSVKKLLKAGVSINVVDSTGRTALHAASEHGCPEIIKILLKNGAEVNAECSDGTTALLCAARNLNFHAMVILLRYGANVNAKNKSGRTALFMASEIGSAAVAEMLLQKGAEVDVETEQDETPLLVAAKGGHEEVVKLLLRFGASVRAAGQLGKTALHEAAEKGRVTMIETLLLHGADPNAEDTFGRPPMHSAMDRFSFCKMWTVPVLKLLLKFGANPYLAENSSPLYGATESSVESFRTLLEHSFPDISIISNVFDPGENRALLYSRFPDYAERCDFLVEHAVKANVADASVGANGVNQHWFNTEMTMNEYKGKCEAEMATLRSECLGDTFVSFYDILMGGVQRLTDLARNDTVCQIMSADDLEEKFPIYASIMKRQFQRGCQRNELRKQGNKLCRFLFSHFTKLPDELKDKIVNYLTDRDLLILIFACSPRNS